MTEETTNETTTENDAGAAMPNLGSRSLALLNAPDQETEQETEQQRLDSEYDKTFGAQLERAERRRAIERANRLDRGLYEFLKTRDSIDEEKAFAFFDNYAKERFGFEAVHGDFWNNDHKPFATADQYGTAMMALLTRGYEGIASERYVAVSKAEASGDFRALAKALGVPTVATAPDPGASPSAGMGFQFQTVERTDDEMREEVSAALAKVKGENFLATLAAIGYDFDKDDKALLRASMTKGDGMPPEWEPHLARVLKESPEKGARLLAMIDRTRRVESHWVYDNIWRPLWDEGIWRSAKNQAAAITDAATGHINASAFHEHVSGSTDSAKYYWNDAERAEYRRLTENAASSASALRRESSVHEATPDEAKRRVDWMCARRLAREALPRAEQLRRRREQLLIEDALGYKQTAEYNYFSRSIAGAFSSVGYMATASVGMGAGFALNTLAQFQQIRDDLLRDGYDPDDALAAQAISAVAWSLVEKAEFATALGRPITGLQKKVLAARIARAAFGKGKASLIGKAVRAGSWELAVTTVAESVEEGVQGGIEGFTSSALRDRGFVQSLADGMTQAAGDFVDSLGSMAIIGGAGMVVKTARSNRDAASLESLSDFAAKRVRAVNAMQGRLADAAELAPTPEEAKRALAEVRATLARHGGDIASALDELRDRHGLNENALRDIGDYLDLQSALQGVARSYADTDAATAEFLADFADGFEGGRFAVGAPGSRLDAQRLYDVLLPGTRVEEVEVPDMNAPEPAPVAAEPTAEQSAAQEAVEAAEAKVAAATVGSARRGAERELRKARKRLEKANAAAPAPQPGKRPTVKAERVTLPSGESYVLVRDDTAPDIHSLAYGQSVAQAMQGAEGATDGRSLSLEDFKAMDADAKAAVAVTPEQYMAMTDAERENYVNANQLYEGGRFRVLDDKGREVLGSDAVVSIKRGYRRFTRTGGNWELAHEHGHFIAQVVAKGMTEEQVATMRRLFGDPTSADERWNEENANDQFAEWLRGKYDFRASTRAERRAKMNWFQKALDTVKHIFALSGERPPVAPVERTMREQAAEAAFNALRNGDFSGLDQFAGIEFGEDAAKPRDAAEGATAAKPTAEARKPTEAAQTQAKPTAAAPKPTRTARKPSTKPKADGAAQGTQDASSAFQAGFDAAMAQIAADPGKFAAQQPLRTGGKMTVLTPDYSMSVEVEPMWIPLAALVESTDDRAVLMRDRTRMATDQQVATNTRKGVFYPLALFPGTVSDRGSPIVGGGNRIISGHGRKRMLDALAAEGRFGEYLDATVAEARRRGLPPPPDGMENPVLVQRVTGGLETREDLVKFAELSNRSNMLDRSGAEFAESDARRITPALLALYHPDASGNLLAVSNRPFMAAFLREVGATGLTDAEGLPTAEAAMRVQRALMAAVFGDGKDTRELVHSLLERSDELSLAGLRNALIRSAGRLLAMKRQRGSFDIVSDVRAAAAQYVAWRCALQTADGLTLSDYLGTDSLFNDNATPMQKALARLLETGRFGATLERYNDLVAQQKVDAQAAFAFFAPRTPLQLLAHAERAGLPLKDGVAEAKGDADYAVAPVTPDPESPEAAAPVQTPPAVQAEPEEQAEETDITPPPAQPAETAENPSEASAASDTALDAAERVLAPQEPETFVPVPAERGTATLPGPGAEGKNAYQVNADGNPTTAVRNLPPGAWNLLRDPYDVRRPPAPSAQDKAGRGLGISAPPPATDSQGRLWNGIFPHFQGNKAEMADRTTQAIRRTMTKAERGHYRTVVDYFGGGGCWGLYHALTNFENARELVVNEFDGDRLEKIRLLHEIDGQVADEAAAIVLDGPTFARIRAIVDDSSSPSTIAGAVERVLLEGADEAAAANLLFDFGDTVRRVADPRKRAVLRAFCDCARQMLATAKDEDGKPVKDAELGVRKALDALREDGKNAKAAADAFKARGGRISYRAGDAATFDDAPSGHEVVAVCDPPYYLTQDYQQGVVLGLDLVPDNWSYEATRRLVRGLVDKGDAIVYTDEAWWNKDSYTPDRREYNGRSTFGREQEALLDIINTLDHFDVAGRVAGRQETLGIQHGHEQRQDGAEADADEQGAEGGEDRALLRPEGAADQGGGDRRARHSVRRVAGVAEAEDRPARRARPHRGRAGDRALAGEVVVNAVADAISSASPDTDPATAAAVARHSVRMVREERMADYARTVSRSAKRWLAAAQRRLDAHMAAHGYTEKVWHGTAGGDFSEFRFSDASHGVPAAYFTYRRETAQNYAALAAMDDAMDGDYSRVNVRGFYVNPGRVLDYDEARDPTDFDGYRAFLAKAYADGYDAVRCRNVLDDQGARLDERDENMTFLSQDDAPGNGEGDFTTDTLIVFDRPGRPGANRVKAADPVTFMDDADGGLPIPLEMRADQSLPDVRYSVRSAPPPKNTGIGYKVFYRRDGKLYPPMVANPNGADTPVGVWLDADAAPVAGTSKTGRPQVKQGGKGTQGGSGMLAYRPGWHLGEIPYALQFNRRDANGERTLFPADFVWAEVEYAADVDYQQEAEAEGVTENGKFRHSYAGLKRLPTDGYYRYRTNPNPQTDPWIITGAMKVNRILSRQEVDALVRAAGREPQPVEPRHSVRRLADGRQYVAVDNVPAEIANEHDLAKKQKLASQLIRSRWAGKVIDEDGVRAFVNGRTAHEYAHPAKPVSEAVMRDKLDAASELEAIVATSTNPRIEPDGKDGHSHDGVREWEYRDAMIQVGSRVYSGKVNIKVLEKENANGEHLRLLHDFTDMKDVTDGVRSLMDASLADDFSADNIPYSAPGAQGGRTRHSIISYVGAGRLDPTAFNPFYKARRMEEQGASPADIYAKTRAFRGLFGKWNYETDPVSVDRKAMGEIGKQEMAADGASRTLKDILVDDDASRTLFKAYPELEALPVRRTNAKRIAGVFVSPGHDGVKPRWLEVNFEEAERLFGKPLSEIAPTDATEHPGYPGVPFTLDNLVGHEIQHAIQALEDETVFDQFGFSSYLGEVKDWDYKTQTYTWQKKFLGRDREYERLLSDEEETVLEELGIDRAEFLAKRHSRKKADKEFVKTLMAQARKRALERYREQIGEKEAALTQVRSAMPPEARLSESPSATARSMYGAAAEPQVESQEAAFPTRQETSVPNHGLEGAFSLVPDIWGTVTGTNRHGERYSVRAVGKYAGELRGNRVERHSVRRGKFNSQLLAEALFAQRILAGREVKAEDADKMVKSLGLTATTGASVIANAKRLADTNRERVERYVRDNAPGVVGVLAASGLEEKFKEALDRAIAGGASAADPDVGRMVQRAIESKRTRDLMAAKGFTAARLMTECPIDLAKGMLAVAEYERTPEEQARLEAARKKREEERRRREAEDDRTDEERLADVDDPTVAEPTEEEMALFNELMSSARFAEAARKGEEERKKRAAAKRKAAEAKERGENADEGADGGADGADKPFEGLDAAYVRRVAPVFEDADLFAQFLIQWTMRAVAEKHPELPATAEMWKSPVAIRELKQTATNILRRLAKDALGSPALNHARNFADHAINELESDAECRTFNAVRRQVAYIYDTIHNDALRMSRRKMVDRLVNGWRENNVTHPGIVQLAGAKGRFSATTEEFQRKIDGRTEMWARTVKRLVYMSEEKLAAYEAEREAVVNANPTAENLRDAPSPDRVKEAQDELVLARKYGGLIRKMPGEISAASEEILSILDGRLQEFEARRLENEERYATIRAAFVNAVNSGKAPRATGKKNAVVRFFESFQGNVVLEMQNLIRYCTDPELRQAALDAIEELTVEITEGGTNYRNELCRCRTDIADGLKAAYGNEVKGIQHLKERLPDEVADAIFSQNRDLAPTYGNLLQLYASAIQADYAENAREHGRDKQLKLMEDTLTDGDKAFHAWAVEWYRKGRGTLSDAVEAVTGVPVTSPDPLYCPVKIDTPHDGFDAEVVAWSPIPRALSKRVTHSLDFRESANFLDVLMEEAEIRAQTIGYSALGIMLRDTLASREVQEAVRRNVGGDDMKDVTDHLRDIVAGDAGRERDRTLDALNVARKWVARFAISGNLSSAMMQPASIPVWANVMLGGEQLGLGRVFKYMTHVDRDAIRELVESGGARARYDMGWSEDVQNMMMNPSAGRVRRWIEEKYDKGMVVSSFADRCSTLWIAQGFYRDAKARFLGRGETEEEAKRKALALTWAAVEATQQTGRTEYLNRAQRGSSKVGKAVFQFRTAQLLANSYLIQAFREAKAGTPGAKGRLARALAINAVIVPAYMTSVSALWAYLLGDEPPEEDESRWPDLMREMAWSMVENTVSPLFVVNVLAEAGVKPILGMQTYGQSSGVPAVDSSVRLFQHGSKTLYDAGRWAAQNLTAMDYEEEVTIDKVMGDLMRVGRDLAAPVRHVYKLYKNRFAEEK